MATFQLLSIHILPLFSKMKKSANSAPRLCSTQFLIFAFIITIICACACSKTEGATLTKELIKGFKATPSPSVSSFQSLLNDPSNTFSLGFLRVNSKHLALAVIHVPSAEQLWQASSAQLVPWSDHTELIFNGSLVISGTHSRVYWSSGTIDGGHRVVLLNSSNLQIQNLDDTVSVLWQSFDFPTNTLVENQNFTSTMSLVSSNGLYSMRLGSNFMGLYANFNEESKQIYWRHRALEAKADIEEGKGPIRARVNSDGYLGMYQIGNVPVDVQAFTSFQRQVSGLLMVRLEPDGNLKGYYWNGTNWVLNYQAISDTCELPSPCGSYGLCTPGSGCSCLDNRTDLSSGECLTSTSGDFCVKDKPEFRVLRRKGVDLPFKELIRYEITSFLEQCEDLCENNCSCWGATYNNASGFCYILDYPIQTLLSVNDESKLGYFKMPEGAGEKKMDVGFGVGIGMLCGGIVILIGAIVFWSYKIWARRRGIKRISEEEDGVLPGPYKNLGSASFRSIEMCNTP